MRTLLLALALGLASRAVAVSLPTETPSATISPTFTISETATPTPTVTASATHTPTISPTISNTPGAPQMTQTAVAAQWTPTAIALIAPANVPVLGPVPVAKGGYLCLAAAQPIGSGKVTFYNGVGQVIAKLDISDSRACLGTKSIAPGIYIAEINADGAITRQKVAITP